MTGTCMECFSIDTLSHRAYCSNQYRGQVCAYCAFELSECGYDVTAIERSIRPV